MDIKPVSQVSDDQEIAKVLAGVNEQIEKEPTEPTGLHFEETAPSNMPTEPILPPPPPLSPIPDSSLPPILPPTMPSEPSFPTTDMTAPTSAPSTDSNAPTSVDPALEGIKKDALSELRPLVDKLNVSAEEKFDTYLLLLRSTDDKSLIAPAHDAAKGIEDEARRAQALLDIIKEIDYLSHNQQAA